MQVVALEDAATTVTTEVRDAVADSDVSLICVGTPSTATGELTTAFLQKVTADIGSALAGTNRWRVVVYRSAMVPGTCGQLIPCLAALWQTAGVDFGVCVNPEFLRRSTSVKDFFEPPKTVVGACDSRGRER